MPFSIRDLKIRNQVWLLTLPPLGVLLGTVVLLSIAYRMAVQADWTARKSGESMAREEEMLRHLTEMYLGVRGYLLTRQPSLLAPYEEAARELPQDLASLRDLESDPARVAEVDAIRVGLIHWQAEWATPTIEKVNRGEAVNMMEVIAEGERRMAPIRRNLSSLLAEDRWEASEQVRAAEKVLRQILILALGLALGIFVF